MRYCICVGSNAVNQVNILNKRVFILDSLFTIIIYARPCAKLTHLPSNLRLRKTSFVFAGVLENTFIKKIRLRYSKSAFDIIYSYRKDTMYKIINLTKM